MQGDARLVFAGWGTGDVLSAGRVAVPVVVVLHVGHTLAGDGMGDDGDWGFGDGAGFFDSVREGLFAIDVLAGLERQ